MIASSRKQDVFVRRQSETRDVADVPVERALVGEVVGVDGTEVDAAIVTGEEEKAVLLRVRERACADGRVEKCGDGALGDGGFVEE